MARLAQRSFGGIHGLSMEQNKESQKVLIPTYFIGILTLGATFQLPNIAYYSLQYNCTGDLTKIGGVARGGDMGPFVPPICPTDSSHPFVH